MIAPVRTEEKVSDQLERWFGEEGPRTLGSLIDMFGEKSFAVVFIVLMAVPALPLPTGGVTHVLEVITMLLALELIAGRRTIWLPQRWMGLDLGGSGGRFAKRCSGASVGPSASHVLACGRCSAGARAAWCLARLCSRCR
jgi:hypothetical protein